MRQLASIYPRYGYRRIRIFLAREGHRMSVDRAHRPWRAAGLQVPRRRPRRRVATSRPRPLPPTARSHVWACDVVFDACATGQQLKCLAVVDEWTRGALAIDVASSIRSGRVIDGKFCDECLSMEWIRSRSEAAAIIETWRRHHNGVRPHSSLGHLKPHEFTKQHE